MDMSVELLFDEFAAATRAASTRTLASTSSERASAATSSRASSTASSPPRPCSRPSEETLALFASLVPEAAGEATQPPLLAERVRRGWRRDEIVDWIRERFGIAEEKREKVARYYHELETGLLPASGGLGAAARGALRAVRRRAAGCAGLGAAGGSKRTLSYLRVQDAPATPGDDVRGARCRPRPEPPERGRGGRALRD